MRTVAAIRNRASRAANAIADEHVAGGFSITRSFPVGVWLTSTAELEPN
jgi:hypothetical protein